MFLLYFIGFILTVFYFLHNKKVKRLKEFTKNINGPKAYPFIGNGYLMTTYKDGMLKYLEKAQKEYGSIMKHWIGSYLFIHLSDPEDVEILLRDTKNLSKSSTYRFTKPWLGNGLITGTGEHWHNHRKILTPTFHFKIIESFVDVFNEKGNILINILKKKKEKNFDIYPYINLYALDAIMETSMGVPINAQENFDSEYVKAIHSITKIIITRSYNVLLRPSIFFKMSKLSKEFEHNLKVIHGYCNKIQNIRKNELHEIDNFDDKIKRDAFLTLLLKGQKSGNAFTEEDIRDEVNSFIFGGHDTMSTAIAFSIYHLARNSEIQQKVYNEIVDLFGKSNADLNFEDLQRTKYLDQVIKEVMRISPPVPMISRELEHDLKLKNVTLPKGCATGVSIYMLHRNPKYFPNPEVFDPERFSSENLKKHPYCYVPFSAGPRNCIGQKYALLELKATLIKILRNFVILPGEDVVEHAFITLTAANGIKVSLEERE